jgi:type II secretory pathway component PulF
VNSNEEFEMINFYTQEEFETQMGELLNEGFSLVQAFNIVSRREREDAAEYERWLDAQVMDREIYNEFA